MRAYLLVPLLALAGCGDGGAPAQNDPPAETARIAAGLWTLDTQVTEFTKADSGAPAINTPAGTRATETVCVGPGDTPPPALFGGAGNDCRSDNIYARNGRLSVQLICTRHGLNGNVMVGANGTFTGDSVTYDRDVRTMLDGDGDVTMNVHVTGRRTGNCTPDSDGGAAGAAGNHAG